jgi:hypothetical protein
MTSFLAKKKGQANRLISIGQLNALLHFHLRPIYHVVSMVSDWDILSWGRLGVYMLSTLILSERSYSAMLLAEQPKHHWFVHSGPLVLGVAPLKYPTPTTDRDQTVSRRFEPNSRTALIGEQPNPWDLLQPQDAMSRHRGAKPHRRYELLDAISLLSPEYLLSVKRRRFHFPPPDH